jgi:RNA polymerase sigma-B factor
MRPDGSDTGADEVDDAVEDLGRAVEERQAELFGRLPDAGAREELVSTFYPLAEYLARRFSGRGEQIDDLIQVASIGLLKAIDRFEVERGVKFSTYAVPTIIGEIKRHFRDTGWAVRVPRRLQERSLQLRSTIAALGQELGRSPTIAEIATRVGLSEEDVLEASEVLHASSVESLDAPVMAGEGTAADSLSLGDEDQTFGFLEGWADVAPLLRSLPDRERRLLYLRFVRDMSQGQIAQMLGISQMHVSRLLARALAKLRAGVGTEGS